MGSFLDTSALAKYYHQELGSEAVERVIREAAGACFISRLGALEMHSVIAMKFRTGEISMGTVDAVRLKFRADIRRKRIRSVPVWNRHYEAAQALLNVYGGTHGLRTLDSLHLASALELFRNGTIDSFVTADRVLCRVAPLEGLNVLNPEV